MNDFLVANKWYPDYAGPNRGYKNPCQPPQRILRQVLGTEDYRIVCKTVSTEHIRAAALMPRGVPYSHLLNVPWSMISRLEEGILIAVSVDDRDSWLDLCRASGARAWMRCHNQTEIYRWTPPELDAQGFEIRPPNAMGITGVVSNTGRKLRADVGQQKKNYSREDVVSDLKIGDLNHTEIGKKHGISRITVIKIAHQEGIRERIS